MVHVKLVLFLVPLFLYCTHNENPFTNPSNARMSIISNATTFKITNDSANIFTTETLTIGAEVNELIDSFSVSAEKNRFWSNKTIHHPSSEYYQFFISFYDTGFQKISITTYRSNNDNPVQDIFIKVNNPLHQDNLPKHEFGDSVLLSSGGVGDNQKIMYNWEFGPNGDQIRSTFSSIKTVINNANEKTGKLWVSDSLYESPKVSFIDSFYDTIPPFILCIDENLVNNTITTSDTLFSFRVRITDRSNQHVTTVKINDASPSYESNNVYTTIFKNISLNTKSNPLKIHVQAIDNPEYHNQADEDFYVIFDKQAISRGITKITITSLTGSTVATMLNTYKILGKVENTNNQILHIQPFFNNDSLKDTIIIGNGNWSNLLTLKNGENKFYILACNNSGSVLDSQSATIFYQSFVNDTDPPVIISKYLNGHSIDDEFTESDTAVIQISAVDVASGIKFIKIGTDSMTVGKNTIERTLTVKNLHHNQNVIPMVIEDFQKNVKRDSLIIIQNSIPTLVSKFGKSLTFPYIVYSNKNYEDTLLTADKDFDQVSILIEKKPQAMKIDSNGVIFWRPVISNKEDTLSLRLRDKYQVSSPFVWVFNVIDSATMAPTIAIANNLNIPPFLQANKDTLKCSIQTIAGTGKRPFYYTAKILNRSISLLNHSTDSLIKWNPHQSDTGIMELQIIVEDSLRFCDTLFRSIDILPENKNASTLKWISTIDTNSDGNIILDNKNNTAFVKFLINDADHPLTESHTITIKMEGQISTFLAKSDTFTLTLNKINNRLADTVQVIVNDKTGTTDTVTLHILYSISSPKEIAGLSNWYTGESVKSVFGSTKVNTWDDLGAASVTMTNVSTTNSLDLKQHYINGYGAVDFNNTNGSLINTTHGNIFDSSKTIFFIARFDSLSFFNSLSLISTSGNDFARTKSTSFGVTKDGMAGFFTQTPSASFGGFTYNTYNTTKSVTKGDWHIFSFSSEPIQNQNVTANIGVDGKYEMLTFPAFQESNIVFGGSYKNSPLNCWNGLIAEVIIFNRVLTHEEYLIIENYIKDKFNLSFSK